MNIPSDSPASVVTVEEFVAEAADREKLAWSVRQLVDEEAKREPLSLDTLSNAFCEGQRLGRLQAFCEVHNLLVLRGSPALAEENTMTTTTTCDQCGNDLTLTDNCLDYRVVLKAETIPTKGGWATSMYVAPPLKWEYHFCNMMCLFAWVGEKSTHKEKTA